MAIEARKPETQEEARRNFRGGVKPIWCPGCGDHAVLAGLSDALAALGLETANVAVITGIGCSSRLPGYLSCYGFNAIHGRAIPIATGVKLSRPEATVIAAGGDGDGFSIGGGHLMHAVRRNLDMTYIVMDNGIYGLTKGQASPTTPMGVRTKTTTTGAYEEPIHPLQIMLAYGTTYVAQGFAGDLRYLSTLFQDAIKHPGFSFVDVVCPCPTYRGGMEQYRTLKAMQHMLTPDNHDESSWEEAQRLAREPGVMHIGVFYRERRATYGETLTHLRETALKGKPAPRVEALAEMYR